MPRPPRARQPLKDAALQLFVEQGIHATGIREISHLAECSEAALYRHWANKETLIGDLYQEHMAEVVALLEHEINAHESFEQQVKAASQAAYALYDANPLVFRFVLLNRHEAATFIPDHTRMPQDVIAELFTKRLGLNQKAVELTAAALGMFLQTAEFVHYGRLPGPLANYAGRVADRVLALFASGA